MLYPMVGGRPRVLMSSPSYLHYESHTTLVTIIMQVTL